MKFTLIVNNEEPEPLPYGLVTWLCPACNAPVSEQEIEDNEAYVSRIGGDSANGYEPIHNACAGIRKKMIPTKADRDEE
jgi:hypothetical protein